jgi:hypothetical protein
MIFFVGKLNQCVIENSVRLSERGGSAAVDLPLRSQFSDFPYVKFFQRPADTCYLITNANPAEISVANSYKQSSSKILNLNTLKRFEKQVTF